MIARIDTASACVWMLLMALGLIAVSSATLHLANTQINPYVLKHVFFMIVAAAVFIGIVQLPLEVVNRFHKIFFLLTLLLAVLVLVPWIGLEAGGGRRWIDLKVATLQVSELARLLIPLFVAGHIAANREALITRTSSVIKLIFLVGIVLGLIFLQPDFGSVVLIGLVTIGMLFLAGARMRDLILIGALGLPVFGYFLYERRNRLAAYLDTWSHASDEGYQLSQSLIAHSPQRLHFFRDRRRSRIRRRGVCACCALRSGLSLSLDWKKGFGVRPRFCWIRLLWCRIDAGIAVLYSHRCGDGSIAHQRLDASVS